MTVVVENAVAITVDVDTIADESITEVVREVNCDGAETGVSGGISENVTTTVVDSVAVLVNTEAGGDMPSIQEVVL